MLELSLVILKGRVKGLKKKNYMTTYTIVALYELSNQVTLQTTSKSRSARSSIQYLLIIFLYFDKNISNIFKLDGEVVN